MELLPSGEASFVYHPISVWLQLSSISTLIAGILSGQSASLYMQ